MANPWMLAAIIVYALLVAPPSIRAQITGDEAEMDRLQARAEELMANGDPEGAAMSMGRAALMATHLAQKAEAQSNAAVYRGAEQLFRAQEHAYRALALYRRAGGQPPASTGVCHTLQGARVGIKQADQWLDLDPAVREHLLSADAIRLEALRAATEDWTTVVASMASDFQCP